MKKVVLGLFATVLFGTAAEAQNKETIYSSVTQEEYAKLDESERQIADLVSCSFAALKGISLDAKNDQYFATINYSTKNVKANGVVIASTESNTSTTNDAQSCHVCGITSAMSCIRKIKVYMNDNGLTTITIEIVMEAGTGCASIKY